MAEKFLRGNEFIDEALEDPVLNEKVQAVRKGNRQLDKEFAEKTSE